MKQISNLLEKANTALTTHKLVLDNKVTDDVYDGYISGFGPAVITAGLLPTLATYLADKKKENIIDAIAAIIEIEDKVKGDELLTECLKTENKPKLNLWKIKIIDASVALKLMIRTYNQ
jgi:CRISPR/Cas system CMR-associated protein Cmr5 small subunit